MLLNLSSQKVTASCVSKITLKTRTEVRQTVPSVVLRRPCSYHSAKQSQNVFSYLFAGISIHRRTCQVIFHFSSSYHQSTNFSSNVFLRFVAILSESISLVTSLPDEHRNTLLKIALALISLETELGSQRTMRSPAAAYDGTSHS